MRRFYSYLIAAVAAVLLAIPASAQKISVSGQVLDASDGQPLIGAGVMLPNGTGTITDYDGKYVIQADPDAVLTFSSLGYVSLSEEINGRTVINVSLNPDTEALEEVVVLGFTSQKKAELTSAVVTMAGEKLTDVTTADVGNMLQGKVAGVMVTNSTGQPGANADIRIRGTGSITAGAGPLYVVDGVAGGSFNPNDIETLTVLKDASATALYGAAAAGGVIVVTTKSAKQDQVQVNFKASGGIKKALTGRFKAMDSYEAYEFLQNFYNKSSLKTNAPAEENLGIQNFDWVNSIFGTGVVQNYYAAVSGKAGKISYYTSLDHYNEQGSMINTGFRRTAARVNLSAPITDRLTMNVRLNYQKSYTDSEKWRTREAVYVMMPFDVPYVMDADGNYTDEPVFISGGTRPDNRKKWYSKNQYNIFHNEMYDYAKSHGEGLTGDIQLIWNVTDWLTLTSTNRYDSSNDYSEEYYDPRAMETTPDPITGERKGKLVNSDSEWNGWGTTNLAKFHKNLDNVHDMSAILGWEYSEGYTRNMSASGEKMPPGQRSLSNTVNWIASGRDYQTRAWALLGQAQYSYMGKYIATASLRYDESYKFGPLNRGGFFPGASVAWVISNENFMKKLPAVSFLKLRAGYGVTGNDNIPAFQYQDLYSLTRGDGTTFQYNNVVAAFASQMANYRLGWEEAHMASVGIDATFKDNWNLTLDLYHTINKKLLLARPEVPSSGYFSVMDNVGKVRNMGIELAADGAIFRTRDFSINMGFNVGVNQNRVLELPDHADMPLQASDVTQMVSENREIYSWYMPKWMGVDPEDGRPMWDHIVTQDDLDLGEYDANEFKVGDHVNVKNYGDAQAQFVGSATPWLNGGLNLSVSWKGLTLSANGSFSVGNKIFNRSRWAILDTDGAQLEYNQQSLNNGLGWIRWKDPDSAADETERAYIIAQNQKATHPQAKKNGNNGAHNLSSRYLEDGSYFRLRNVTLSYDLPAKLISKVKMSGARIYVSADNLFTYTKFSGMDPEVNIEVGSYSLPGMYSDIYPVPMSVVMGIDIKF